MILFKAQAHRIIFSGILLFYFGKSYCQERLAKFDDGTKLYYTIIDTSVRQMHPIKFDVGVPTTIAYFNPESKILAEVWTVSSDELWGADGYYFLAKSTKKKKITAQAKETPAGTLYGGSNTMYLMEKYSIPMEVEKIRYYAVHFQYAQAGNYLNYYPAIPELSVGGAFVTGWGIKYMIRDKQMENTKFALKTYRAENLHCLGVDLLYYPVNLSAWNWNRTYNIDGGTAFHQLGVKVYIKGWLPFWSHRDFCFYYLFGLENTFYGFAGLGGIGLGGGY